MVKSTIYKGIEFVRLSSMSKSDQELFQKTFNPHLYIKILMDEEIVHDCIQYKDYISWYAKMFPKSSAAITVLQDAVEHESESVLVH
jgi:hypothetical protein